MNCKPYLILLLTGMAVLLAGVSAAQSLALVQEDRIKTPGVADAQIGSLNPTQKQTTITYYDGLGRPLQQVAEQASPLQHDMVQPVAYDNLGRQTAGYLPYTDESTATTGSYRANAISSGQPGFYNQSSQYLVPTDGSPYAQKIFENSPLQRLLSAGNVGAGFQPAGAPLTGGTGTQHYKTAKYRFNTSADGNILVWNPDGSYTSGTYYAANILAVTDGIDEDNVETLTFTDLEGHLILKRQKLAGNNVDTYYIYNNAGMIAFIIPPGALALMVKNGSYSISQTGVSALIFQFSYNGHGQLIQKTVPGKGAMSIVYDPLNRPVLLQDANMLASNQWNYIKYDAKGRAVSQGIYTDATTSPTSHIGQANMQAYVNTLAGTYQTTYCESRSGTLTNSGYYTDTVFPTTGITPLAYAYYDDYDLNQNGSPDFTYVTTGLTGEAGATTAAVKGMPTMVSKTTVGAGIAAGTWLTSVTFYDKRLNPVQTQSNNQLNYTSMTTLTDVKTVVPDFSGVPQVGLVKKVATSTTTVQTNFTYDQVYRVSSVSQAYNGGASTVVAAYTYNELGQVIKKGLGYVNATTYLQNVDMRYSIRGQLLSINNSKLTNDNGVTNSDANDVFGMQMLYDQTDANVGNTASYDGKLTAVKWMSGNGSGTNTYERSYKYTYDGMNRYTAATYAERTGASTGTFSNNISGFDESGITYDVGGNILTLNRNSSTQGTNTHVQIDALTYTYNTANPDQLLSVADASGNALGFVAGSGNYAYDANGNLTTDPYKKLSIGYDYLNRTDKITVTTGTGQYISYTYDAGGNLIRKQAYKSGATTIQTDYIDGFVYVNSTLSYFPMPEGRVLNNGGTLVQEFIITDPQGNARVSFQNNGSGVAAVKQENSYYGFGMQLPNSPVGLPGTPNKQLYNGGSEWQNDYSNLPDYYQTFNRNYDAALGRFVGVDPEAESAESMSSYQYAGNNPIMFNDPDGNKRALNILAGGSSDSEFDQEVDGINAENSLADEAADFVAFGTSTAGSPNMGYTVYRAAGSNAEGPPAVGTLAGALASIYANTSVALGGFNTTLTSRGTYYEYQTDAPTTAAANSLGIGGGVVDHFGLLPDDASQGGVITINRIYETDQSTISTFTLGDGTKGYILERPGPSTTTRGLRRRIPAGTYKVTPHSRPDLDSQWELYNDDVPTSRGILIHIGNGPGDTDGCLIPGLTMSTDYVSGSRGALDQINDYINSFNGNVTINIYDPIKFPPLFTKP